MKAIILAAGYATRLHPLTLNTPKALLPIGGRAMLDHLVEGIARIENMKEVHIVSNRKFSAHFEAWKAQAEQEERYPQLTFRIWNDGTRTSADCLGAVGDIDYVIRHAALDDDILVAAADNFFTFPLKLFVEAFYRQGRDMLLAGYIPDVETLRRFAVAELDHAVHSGAGCLPVVSANAGEV